ncbi:hypothetical protein Y032_0938g3124 [Ancylostoma ceylanicum]|uniref:Uncharacterized protein n=1 Tax=Ancylostoma ceylanicum TaxID=53326 RepID=A0A016W8B8_9BILA|nr:hypothetical protein Y032_0938g3124 [Ancylostoma ceylanicum]
MVDGLLPFLQQEFGSAALVIGELRVKEERSLTLVNRFSHDGHSCDLTTEARLEEDLRYKMRSLKFLCESDFYIIL